MTGLRLVVLESPYSGEVAANVEYARACVLDCLKRGEAPIASHLLFTQPGVLRDARPEEREVGMKSGWAWMAVCDAVVVYTDRGISGGMQLGIDHALKLGKPVECRSLGRV